ncbi:Hypothetical predicted protein [Cloeon dipterum]|uniref:Uncharacterized protein n=1 Tax=Cloeon dipterum TaxID=197152 RepID=A0A8S1CUB0_9INSE|nr:Hypothetical predicted protein [Cloeon dipterum]
MEKVFNVFETIMSLSGATDEEVQSCKELFRLGISDLTHEELIELLRPLSNAEWPLTKFFEVFADSIKRVSYTEINLDDFSLLRPSDLEFELKVLQKIVSSKATEITAFRINSGENLLFDPPKLEPQLWTEIIKLQKVEIICISKYKTSFRDLPEMCKSLPSLRKIKVMIDSSIPVPTEDNFAQEFSKVNSLWVDWSDWNEQVTNPLKTIKLTQLHNFRDLDTLTFFDLTSPKNLDLFLNSVGQKLIVLNLYYTSVTQMKISLNLIQRSCPILESLDIGLAGVDDSNSLASFKSLLELKISFIPQISKNVRLSNLLAAPKLKIVLLRRFQVSRQELKQTISSIKNKIFLKNIKYIHLELEATDMSWRMREMMENEGNRFKAAVRNLNKNDEEKIKVEFTTEAINF